MKLANKLELMGVLQKYSAAMSNMVKLLFVLLLIQILAWLLPAWPNSSGIPNYIPWHEILETISIVISMMVFLVGWNSKNKNLSGNVVLLASVFFSVGLIDFFHTVTYVGMPQFFSPNDDQKHLNYWLAARFIAAVVLLVVVVREWKPLISRIARYIIFSSLVIFTLSLNWAVTYHQSWFPDTFIPRQGLTQFKKNFEYMIIIINLVTAVIMLNKMSKPQPYKIVMLFGAVCTLAMSEFYFTIYTTMLGSYNILGHVYKVIAYLLIYRAIVVEVIEEPYNLLEIAKNELEQSESRYRHILEQAPIGIVTNSLDGHFIKVNEAFCHMLGYEKEELEKLSYQNVTHPDDKTLAHIERQKLLDGEIDSYQLEKRYIHKDGHIVWGQLTSSVEKDIQGEPFFIAQVEDITVRKQASDALQRSKDIFQAIQFSITESIFLLDKTGVVLAVNPTGAQRLGKRPCEVMGQDVFTFFPPEVAGPRRAIKKEVIRTLIPRTIEDVRNGRVFASSYYPVINDQNQCEAVVVVGTDITERKLSEQALLKSEALFRKMAENSPLAIYMTSGIEEKAEYINPTFIKLFGYTMNDVTCAADWWPLAYPDKTYRKQVVDEWERKIARAVETSSEIGPMEVVVTCKDGSKKDISWAFVSSGDQNWSFGLDLTERKNRERQLVLMNTALNKIKDAAYLMDKDGKFLYVNDEASRILGYTRETLLGGMGVTDIDPNATIEIYQQHWEEIKTNHSLSREATHRTKDGNTIPIELTANYFEYDGQGYNLVLVRDIFERKRAESELRVAATAFESQEGMTITDAKGTIIRVNHAFTNITGYSAEEVIGQNPRILKSGRQDANFYAIMWEKINSTGAWEGEIWNRRKNGEIFPEHLTITAVKGSDGIISNYVATLSDITQTKAAEDEIKHLAFYDPLTLLPNRRLLLDRLRQALASIARSGQTGALLFIDLDNFKTLNDTLGHDIGDLLLQQVAQRLESSVREGDTVARLGGDEFVVMLEDLSMDSVEAAEQTESIGSKISFALNQPYQLASREYHNTPSIGITLFGNYSKSIDDLMKQADIAMYQSKKAGRNTLRFFDPQMQEAVDARASLESELRHALGKNELEVFYQPIVDSKTGKIHKAEALLRWKHPTRGMISPAKFIPLAEESGLILEIGEWVFMEAINTIEHWKSETGQIVQVSVNKSPVQFVRAERHPWLERLANSGLPKGCIAVEITEGLLITDSDKIRDELLFFQKQGIEVSIDDFGTGFSSLSYLNQFDIDYLKIDISFIKSIIESESNRALTEAIIVMAHKLGIKTIAEGVETEAQRDMLIQFGCNYMQGFLYSKPVTANEFMKLLRV